jgi:hypothetical protein
MKQHMGQQLIEVRDVNNKSADNWSLQTFADYTSSNDPTKALIGRYHGCPESWAQLLVQHVPVCPLQGGDLFADLPEHLRAITVGCDIEAEESRSCFQNAWCGALMHSLMIHSEQNAASYWFIVRPSERAKAEKAIKSRGQLLVHEMPWVEVSEMTQSPFEIEVIRQQEGDLVLLPADSYYQTFTLRGRAVKAWWHRVVPHTVRASLQSLHVMHKFCRPEKYRIKTLAFFGLNARTERILSGTGPSASLSALVHECGELTALIEVVNEHCSEEWISADHVTGLVLEPVKVAEQLTHSRTCAFCAADIWNRCFHCARCAPVEYDICLQCVAEGRGCVHNTELTLHEALSMRLCKHVIDRSRLAHRELLARIEQGATAQPGLFLDLVPKFQIKMPDQSEHSIATVAYSMVRRYHIDKDEWCHQCKLKKQVAFIVTCHNGRCSKRFCGYCLWNRYCLRQVDIEKMKNWKCLVCSGMCNCARCMRNRSEDSNNLQLKFDDPELSGDKIVVPNFLKENSKARGSIYDREPRPRATSEKERRAISSPNLLISYRTKPAIADRLASLTHAKGSPSGSGKAYRTRSKGDLTVILNDSDSEVGNTDNADYQGWYVSETSSVASNDSARDRRSGRLSTTLDLTDELDSDSTDESRSPTPRRSLRARKRGSRTLDGEEIGPEIVIRAPFPDSPQQVPASPSSSRKRARLGSVDEENIEEVAAVLHSIRDVTPTRQRVTQDAMQIDASDEPVSPMKRFKSDSGLLPGPVSHVHQPGPSSSGELVLLLNQFKDLQPPSGNHTNWPNLATPFGAPVPPHIMSRDPFLNSGKESPSPPPTTTGEHLVDLPPFKNLN